MISKKLTLICSFVLILTSCVVEDEWIYEDEAGHIEKKEQHPHPHPHDEVEDEVAECVKIYKFY